MRFNPIILLSISSVLLTSCSINPVSSSRLSSYQGFSFSDYSSRLPAQIRTGGERVVLFSPRVHAWGAYSPDGQLLRAGLATGGAHWCSDIKSPCRTSVGSFRVYLKGGPDCISRKFPLPHGGGLMPYCMYFHGGMALHGSPDNAVVEGNISHGCVRMRIPDAEWLSHSFVSHGTKVVVQPY